MKTKSGSAKGSSSRKNSGRGGDRYAACSKPEARPSRMGKEVTMMAISLTCRRRKHVGMGVYIA